MKRTPEIIALEFSRNEDPKVRRNACTALSIIQSPKAIFQLVHIMLLDSNKSVRLQAENQILALPEKATQVAIETLGAIVSGGPTNSNGNVSWIESVPASQGNVTALAGEAMNRLLFKGLKVRQPDLPIRKRIYLVQTVEQRFSTQYPSRSDWAATRPGLVGGLIGATVFAAYLLSALGTWGELGELVSLSVATGLIIAPLAAVWITGSPIRIGRHIDKRMAGTIEFVRIFRRVTIGLAILFGIAVLALQMNEEGWQSTHALLWYMGFLLAWFMLGVAAIRAGTLLGGSIPGAETRSPTWAFIVGACCGILTITSLAIGADAASQQFTGAMSETTLNMWEMGAELYHQIWLATVPVVTALSYSFVTADLTASRLLQNDSPLTKGLGPGLVRRVSAWVILIVLAVPLILAAWPGILFNTQVVRQQLTPLQAPGNQKVHHQIKLPYKDRFPITLTGPHSVHIMANPAGMEDLVIVLLPDGEELILDGETDPQYYADNDNVGDYTEILSVQLKGGKYDVLAMTYEDFSLQKSGLDSEMPASKPQLASDKVLHELLYQLNEQKRRTPAATVTLTLTPDVGTTGADPAPISVPDAE